MCNHSIRTFRWCISYFTCWSKLESCFIDSVKSSPVIAAQPATAVNRSLTRLQKTQLPLFHPPTGSIPPLLIMTGQTDTMILCRTAPPTVIIRGCKILFWQIKPHIFFPHKVHLQPHCNLSDVMFLETCLQLSYFPRDSIRLIQWILQPRDKQSITFAFVFRGTLLLAACPSLHVYGAESPSNYGLKVRQTAGGKGIPLIKPLFLKSST